ncbi:putative UDP-glucose,sterol transferase [Aspergillus affinis]|uniref:putative UDP-glucose,sterol transferase n=1 Tax=Aspergillus affinis TaxID=1070780 RepID=UPI0022FE9055|nr:UDP-Glycosyltransferase/glycogen phosphorylase [Aspergillus affinis]KAI9044678.1 UDP-Glycosyltransferase/glycogen phosphorylase [Aspergillus affinis]
MSEQGIPIQSGDWPENVAHEHPSVDHGNPHRHGHTVRERGLNTGVRVMDDGRLDIKFRSHKPWLTKLVHLIDRRRPQEPSRKASVLSTTDAPFPLRLNIVIQVVGSRGDVQPFLALGKRLRSHGHRVRLATHLAFRDDVLAQGLEFFNIGGDPAELMAFMVKNPGLMPDMSTIRSGAIRKRRREMKAIFSGCWRSCFETGDGTGLHHVPDDPWSGTVDAENRPFVADAIIANPPSFVHLSCAEKLGVPVNLMFTMPWSATQAFPHPLANVRSQSTKPSAANFASYAIVEVMMWEGLGDLINRFRKRELGLDPLDAIRAPSIPSRLRIPSPSLLPKPADWADTIDVCGFSTLPHESSYQPPDDLAKFLESGPPPIYIGFGSIVVDNPGKLTQIVFDAVRQTGQRALISKGWGNIGGDNPPDNVLLLGKCPHDWLFQHVAAVVHHGGAGTTAAGLLLGRPTVIVPFFGDQPFWGSIVARAGAGPPPVPYKQLTADKLTEAIQIALKPETREKAEKIGKDMRQEDGVRDAVASFHNHLDVDSLRCSICPKRPAVWFIRQSRIRLSTFAAAVLVETGLVNTSDVVLYRSQEYDTNRDPQGPLTAGAEVLYGIVTDLIAGVATLPGNVVDMFSHEPHEEFPPTCKTSRKSSRKSTQSERHSRTRSRNSRARSRSEPTMQSQLESNTHSYSKSHSKSPSTSNSAESTEYNTPEESINSNEETTRTSQSTPEPEPDPASASSAHRNTTTTTTQPIPTAESNNTNSDADSDSDTASISTTSNSSLGAELDLEQTLTRQQTATETRSSLHEMFLETSYHMTKIAKHALDFAILLPHDLTLSLSKGFHNAPKLYHDRTVKETPRVLGVKSGFRAAGTEFTEGFYNGITGLVTQPFNGAKKTGPRGFIKGIGKGMGGVVFKPVAGVWGLAGYPLDGMHKSLRKSLSKSKTKDILKSRIAQGMEEMCLASTEERAIVIRRWEELTKAEKAEKEMGGESISRDGDENRSGDANAKEEKDRPDVQDGLRAI